MTSFRFNFVRVFSAALTVVAGMILAGCCTPPAKTGQANPVRSPAAMGRLLGGYSLVDPTMTAVISADTGDVQFWSNAVTARNRLYRRGIFPTFSGLPIAAATGHVEKRDDQTWQYYGEDTNHLIWRKIYNLENDMLLVSYMVENNTGRELIGKIQVVGDLPATRVVLHEPEQFTGQSQFGTLDLHGFNEYHHPASQPVLPVLIESDTFHLKPKERQSFTTQWMLK